MGTCINLSMVVYMGRGHAQASMRMEMGMHMPPVGNPYGERDAEAS